MPQGVFISERGTLTMIRCTSTGEGIYVEEGASLVIEDSRVICCGSGVDCKGKVKLTRCTIEENREIGVSVSGGSAELVDCVIRKNGEDGVVADEGANVRLRRGTVSGNAIDGVVSGGGVSRVGAKVTVSEEHPPDVKNNAKHDWVAERGGVLEGVAEEKITRDPEEDV